MEEAEAEAVSAGALTEGGHARVSAEASAEKVAKKKKKKKRKPKAKPVVEGGEGAAESTSTDMVIDSEEPDQPPSIRFGQLERACDEILQTYATAQGCVERRDLEEALEQHYAVVRAADLALERFLPNGYLTNSGDGAESFTEREQATKVPDTLLDIRSKRRCSMGEAVNLLAHAERYEHVPPLCTQLLESPENEQDEIRWLFHRCVRGPQHIACYSAARRL
jgi:hypothetical protein